MSILVTGASGQLGRLVVEALLARGVAPSEVVAAARRPEALDGLAARGVATARLDYDDPASARAAMAGVDRLLLVSGPVVGNRVAQHTAVIDAAAAAGVELLAYTSFSKAATTTMPLGAEHRGTETVIRASGLPYALLRNNWYSEGYLGTLAQARETGEVVASVGDGRVASVARADLAEAAAAVLATGGHENTVYELGGDHAWDYDELAEVLTDLLERNVVHRRITPEEHQAALVAAGAPEGAAAFAVSLDTGIREGWLGEVTGDLSRLVGRPTVPLIETLRAGLTR